MSIALLHEVYDETRRLSIAGSVVAPGDFRLKKLIAPLEQVGAKAPVFAKVAESVKGVIESTENTSSEALLDLATLVNAILYTQGETGSPGELEPITTTDLGLKATQTSARVLKPMVEALTTTGSGRLEVVRDAHERGVFRDLRLIQPSVAAIDDVFGELAEFVRDQILPIYGAAILPLLRNSFDMKGRTGHARRLMLMHKLDPAGTRDIIMQSLEEGSKEVKIAAIDCLGSMPDDVSFLLEQATSKSNEVRQAAYRALAGIDNDAVVAVFQESFRGKDLGLAASALRKNRNPKLLKLILSGIEDSVEKLFELEEKKEISTAIDRLSLMLQCIEGRDDKGSEALLIKLFGERDSLMKIKGETSSGSELNHQIVRLLAEASRETRKLLAESHEKLAPHELRASVRAAQQTLTADQVFALFSPYLIRPVESKKKERTHADDKRNSVADTLTEGWHVDRLSEFVLRVDSRWLDVAVQVEDLRLIQLLIRPGHSAANAYLSKSYAEHAAKPMIVGDFHRLVAALVRGQHPQASDATVRWFEEFGDKPVAFHYNIGIIIADLPKSAIPRLEALIPKLPDRIADSLLGYLQQLRDKPE